MYVYANIQVNYDNTNLKVNSSKSKIYSLTIMQSYAIVICREKDRR